MPRTPRIPRMSPACPGKCSTEHYTHIYHFLSLPLPHWPPQVVCSRDKPLFHYDHHRLSGATVSSWNPQTVQSTVGSVKKTRHTLSFLLGASLAASAGFSEDIISVLHSTLLFQQNRVCISMSSRHTFMWQSTWCIHDCCCFSDSQCFVS